MRWTKRLKWLRISKIVIPIALAISIVFAGFTVYAHEAEYFVMRINAEDDVKLALTMNRDLSEQTSILRVPVVGRYEDVTYTENKSLLYNPKVYSKNLPDDIAKHDGVHSVYKKKNGVAFYSFSFWLVNNSTRAVDVDMKLNIDEMTVSNKESNVHIDGAVRIMVIEGEPLLSDHSYTVYKKTEISEENQKVLDENVQYGNVLPFASDICVFNREGDLGYRNFGKGEAIRFTIVLWLEGWDVECIDEIRQDSLKMSIDFSGY